jgi:methionine-rich copper-binding protein CopC
MGVVMPRRASVAVFSMVLVALVAIARPPSATAILHLRLTASSPAKDTVLTAAPTRLVLTYSQEPQVRLSSITLTGPAGAVALSPVVADSTDKNKLVSRVTGTMRPGTYVIAWRTASSDGHPIRGEIPFTLRAASGN